MAEDKVKFFIQTAHDLRTPLTLIKAPLEEISRNEKLTSRGEQNVQTALKSANDLIIFASDLLNLERQKIKETCLHLSSVNLNIYLQELIIPFQLYARTKHLDLIFNSATNGKVWIDRSRMDSIMYNIINNALKYTQPNGSVIISANMSEQDWTVTVSDTGIGIPEDELPKMAEMFYRSKNVEGTRIEGTGMGLNLVKQLVDEHYGSMALSSEEGKGTTFTLTFPIDYEKRKNVKKITGDAPDGKKTLDSPRVLVVEDSIDLREFMVRSLSESYYVYVAENGQEAYSKIRFLNPDIVVSDVMMPYMRGDELCRKIKAEVETSHIPIILLTALADSDSVIDGLSTLADAYLTKPFSVDLLKAQIDNILSNRKSLQKLYSRLAIAPKGTSEAINVANSAEVIGQANMSGVDVDFIKSVSAIVDAHIRDAEFNVDILCTSIGMSRTSFYNKLKSLTGYPPADFVRLRRVEKSKYLLLNSELSIQEISERCGFVDVKYFREVFRKNVKCSPRDFRKGNVSDSGLKEEADASASS
jgi:CheY-like chemotaxis protein